MKRISDAVVFGGVIAAIVLTLVFAPPARGPLYHWQSDGGYNTVAAPMRPGEVLAAGIILLEPQPTPIALIGVRPLHPQDARGVTLRYGATIENGRMGFGNRDGWQPSKWQLRPVAGFTIPAHARATVVVGASSTQKGVHYLRGFILDYRIGAWTYSAPQQAGLAICVRTRRCPALP